MKYYFFPIILVLLVAVNFTIIGHAQTTLNETQNQKIREVCNLEPYLDPAIHLQVMKEGDIPLSKDQQYQRDCIEIAIDSYENNETHDEMMNKLTDLWMDTYS